MCGGCFGYCSVQHSRSSPARRPTATRSILATHPRDARDPDHRGSKRAGFEFESWTGFLAPTGTPPDVISKINGEVVRITRLPETNERLPGFEWVGSTPQEFGEYIKADIARMGKVVREAGIKAE